MKIQKEQSVSLDDCTKIILDSLDSDVIISSSDDDNLKIIESCSVNLKEDDKFNLEKQGSTVLICNKHLHFSINLYKNFSKNIELFIPKSYTKNLDLKLTFGDITINNDLILNNGKYTQGSGDIKHASGIAADQIDIKSFFGDTKLLIPQGAGFESYGKSTLGDINSDYDLNYKNRNKATSKVGDGPYRKINVRTFFGDINLNQQ